MKISVIQVPYDTALYDTRMGRGPGRFLKEGAIERLEALGHQVSLSTVDPRPSFPAEVETSFELMRLLADEVRSASESGAFPLVLAGNCNMSVGIVSGLAPRRAGVVWFDGHADFETPESTGSGFIDGMGLAIITGHCWQPLARLISGYTPVPEERVILAGAREIDPYESDRLVSSNITYTTLRGLRLT